MKRGPFAGFRIGSLFSGIGGLELGLERRLVGSSVRWQVEIDPFCRKVLAKHWPQARRFDDVTKVGGRDLERVHLVCGGFPCQDLSVAGRSAGLAGARSGLWREFARILGDTLPGHVVVENISHGRERWLPYVRADLEALGYRTRAYLLAASDVGAPHQRRRCFIVADAYGEPLRVGPERGPCRWPRRLRGGEEAVPLDARLPGSLAGPSTWPPAPQLSRVDDGFPDRLDRNRAIGNAVSPIVSAVIGAIVEQDFRA